MHHGDLIDVSDHELFIDRKAVEPLGIRDGAVCWGVWIEGESPRPFDSRPDEEDFPFRFPHLVISSIPPDIWASAMTLTLELDDEPGTLDAASGVLAEVGLNLLLIDSSPSGFKQASFSAVVEHHELTDSLHQTSRFRRLDEIVDRLARARAALPAGEEFTAQCARLDRARRRLLLTIGRHVVPAMVGIETRIRASESEMFDVPPSTHPFRGWLRSRIVEYGSRPWFLSLHSKPAPPLGEAASRLLERLQVRSEFAYELAARRAFTLGSSVLGAGALPASPTSDPLFAERSRSGASRGACAGRPGDPTDEALHALKVRSSGGARAWIDEKIRQSIASHATHAAACRALLNLMHAWTWRIRYARSIDGAPPEPVAPVCFRYSASRGSLRIVDAPDTDGFPAMLSRFHDRRWMRFAHAAVTFDRQGHDLRLRFLRSEYVRRRAVRVLIDYKVRGGPSPSGRPRGSPGLLKLITDPIRREAFDLLRISNKIGRSDSDGEHGAVRLILTHAGSADWPSRLRRAEARIRSQLADQAETFSLRKHMLAWPILVTIPRGLHSDLRAGAIVAIGLAQQHRRDMRVALIERGNSPMMPLEAPFDRVPSDGLLQIIAATPQSGGRSTVETGDEDEQAARDEYAELCEQRRREESELLESSPGVDERERQHRLRQADAALARLFVDPVAQRTGDDDPPDVVVGEFEPQQFDDSAERTRAFALEVVHLLVHLLEAVRERSRTWIC